MLRLGPLLAPGYPTLHMCIGVVGDAFLAALVGIMDSLSLCVAQNLTLHQILTHRFFVNGVL